jgi:hypothetical protein
MLQNATPQQFLDFALLQLTPSEPDRKRTGVNPMSANSHWSNVSDRNPTVIGPDDDWWHDNASTDDDEEQSDPNPAGNTAVILGDIWDQGGVVLYDSRTELHRYLTDALRQLAALDPEPDGEPTFPPSCDSGGHDGTRT